MKKILGLSITLLTSLYLVACSVTENTHVVDNNRSSNVPVEINHQHTHTQISDVDKRKDLQQFDVAKVNSKVTPKAQINIKSFEMKPAIRPPVKPRSDSPRIKKTIVRKHYPQHKPRRTVLTNAQRFSGVLEAHNGVRRKHGLQPLTWSAKLANYSKQWTDHLGSGSHCQIRHRSGTPPYGENLYRASALRWSTGEREILPVTIRNVVKAWTDEERWYDYNRNRCQPGKQCGHYTQIVWRKTTEVGCALKVCADKSQTWVCSYNPPGNFQGVKPY